MFRAASTKTSRIAALLVGSSAAVIVAAIGVAEHGYSQVDSIADTYIAVMLASRNLDAKDVLNLQPSLHRNVTLLDSRVEWSLQKHRMLQSVVPGQQQGEDLAVYRLEWMKVHLRGLSFQLQQQEQHPAATQQKESEMYDISSSAQHDTNKKKPHFEEELEVVYDTRIEDSYLDLDSTVRAHEKLDALLPKKSSADKNEPIHVRHAQFQSQFMIAKRDYESTFTKLVNDVLDQCKAIIPELLSATVTQHYIDEANNSVEAYVDTTESANQSKMVVNIARSISYDKAQQLAVHELTHHFQNVLMEQHLYQSCPEMRIAPLFGPMGLLLEGGAEAFVDLYFNNSSADAGGLVDRVQDLQQRMPMRMQQQNKLGGDCSPQQVLNVEQVSWFGLWSTIIRIARDYQNGQITRDETIQLMLEQALKRHDSWPNVDFFDQVGAYTAGYGYGKELILRYCFQQAAKNGSTALQEYIQFMKRPILPSQMMLQDA